MADQYSLDGPGGGDAFAESLRAEFEDRGLLDEYEFDDDEPADSVDKPLSEAEFKQRIVDAKLPLDYRAPEVEPAPADEPDPAELRERANVGDEELEELRGWLATRPDLDSVLGEPRSDEEAARNLALARQLYRGSVAEGALGYRAAVEQQQQQAEADQELYEEVEDELLYNTFTALDKAAGAFGFHDPRFQQLYAEAYTESPQETLQWHSFASARVQQQQAQQAAEQQALAQAAQQQEYEQEYESRGETIGEVLDRHPELNNPAAADAVIRAALALHHQSGADMADPAEIEAAIRIGHEVRRAEAVSKFKDGILNSGYLLDGRETRYPPGDPFREVDPERLMPVPTRAEFLARLVEPEPSWREVLGIDQQIKEARAERKREELRKAGFLDE